jgi:protein tyrosine phosphatase
MVLFPLEKDELTRVRLPQRNFEPLSTYINANYINGYNDESRTYIATQGPMSNTLNDFWYMIWNERVRSVIMITRLKEKNKTKCDLYIPEKCNEPILYGNITVAVVNVTYKSDFEIRQLKISVSLNVCFLELWKNTQLFVFISS